MSTSDNSLDDLGLAAGLARAYSEDQNSFLPLIAGLMESALPENEVTVERKPIRLFSSEKHIVGVTANLGDEVFMLHRAGQGHALEAIRRKIVRGITLKTESIEVEDWLAAVGERLRERAAKNERAYFALQNFMEVKRL